MASGTLVWSLTDISGGPCHTTAPTTVTTLGPDDANRFSFDHSVNHVIGFEGYAAADGPLVDVTVSCPDDDPVVSSTEAGGVWFLAPEDEHYDVAGDLFSGRYNNGAQLPSVNSWSLHRVE